MRPFTVAYVGRLIESKNLVTLLRAFAEANVANSRLLLVGDGIIRGALEAEAHRLGISHQMRITGMILRRRVFELFSEIDLVVSTSLVEGLPKAILEAMAGRKPVILSDIEPHQEVSSGLSQIPPY